MIATAKLPACRVESHDSTAPTIVRDGAEAGLSAVRALQWLSFEAYKTAVLAAEAQAWERSQESSV